MKIKITNKIKIELNKKTLLLFFVFIALAMLTTFLFFGFDLSQKPGTAQEIKKDTSLEIDTEKIEKIEEYKNLEIFIDSKNGIGKSNPL
jgi:hypothetical protein